MHFLLGGAPALFLACDATEDYGFDFRTNSKKVESNLESELQGQTYTRFGCRWKIYPFYSENGVKKTAADIRRRKRGPFDSAKNHKHLRRKRQSVTAKREKSQTPKLVKVRLGQVRLGKAKLG